jgi:hypothetical protein
MTSESRNSPVLDNGSLTHLSVTKNSHVTIHELLEVVVPVPLTRVIEGRHMLLIREVTSDQSSFIRKTVVVEGSRSRKENVIRSQEN